MAATREIAMRSDRSLHSVTATIKAALSWKVLAQYVLLYSSSIVFEGAWNDWKARRICAQIPEI